MTSEREQQLNRYRMRHLTHSAPMFYLRSPEKGLDEAVHDCLSRISASYGRMVLRIAEPAAAAIELHAWKSYDALEEAIEFAVLSGKGPVLLLSELPAWVLSRHRSQQHPKAAKKQLPRLRKPRIRVQTSA